MLAIRRALAFGAHPDDVELQAGGTLAAWAARGVHVELACFTAGEKGSPDPAADPAALGRVRRAEAEAAALALGAAVPVHFLGAVDGELEVTTAMRMALARLVRTVRPDVVVGHDPWRRWLLHPDHRAAGLLTVDGVVAAREPLYEVSTGAPPRDSPDPSRPTGAALASSDGEEPDPLPAGPPRGSPDPSWPLAAHRPHTVLLFGTDAPDELVDVTGTIEAKLAAVAAHASQVADRADLERRVRTWNAAIGAGAGLQYAEAFHTLDTRGR
jgi:LmbE family N-acetylglucosaminyl deacetylase